MLRKNIKDLSEESQKKIHSNCLRILDSKDSKDNKISLLAPKIISYLSSESLNHYESYSFDKSFLKKSITVTNHTWRAADKLYKLSLGKSN